MQHLPSKPWPVSRAKFSEAAQRRERMTQLSYGVLLAVTAIRTGRDLRAPLSFQDRVARSRTSALEERGKFTSSADLFEYRYAWGTGDRF